MCDSKAQKNESIQKKELLRSVLMKYLFDNLVHDTIIECDDLFHCGMFGLYFKYSLGFFFFF